MISPGFSLDTAPKVGASPRTVQRNVCKTAIWPKCILSSHLRRKEIYEARYPETMARCSGRCPGGTVAASVAGMCSHEIPARAKKYALSRPLSDPRRLAPSGFLRPGGNGQTASRNAWPKPNSYRPSSGRGRGRGRPQARAEWSLSLWKCFRKLTKARPPYTKPTESHQRHEKGPRSDANLVQVYLYPTPSVRALKRRLRQP